MKLIKTESIPIEKPIMDWGVYPRQDIDRVRVNEYLGALRAGAIFPPIRLDIKTAKIVDGFHRMEMYRKAGFAILDAEFYEFENEAELIWWSINWNAQHGLKLTRYDQTRCLNMGRELGLSDEQIAKALCMTIEKITALGRDRVRIHADTGKPVEVKKVLSAITSETVTQRQLDAQKPFNCMPPSYDIKRAIDSLKANLLPINESNIVLVTTLQQECENWLKEVGLKRAN